jgi:hypothetical protein
MGVFRTALSALFGGAYGALVPPKVWAKRLLEQELRDHGIDPACLSDACLQELADDEMRGAERIAWLSGKKCSLSDRIGAIENCAHYVVSYLLPRDYDPLDQAIKQTPPLC